MLSHVRLFATPWTAALQASLSFTISWSLLKLMSIESVMPSNHLILCHSLLLLPSIFPSIESFPMSWLFASSGQSIRALDSASASVLPMNQSISSGAQSCLTLCDPIDCSPPGSSIHGIFQARVLEWVAISFSRGSSKPRDRTRVSHIVGRRFTI